jgi:cardiolipin synthase A/B
MLTAFVKGAKRQILVYDVNLQDPLFIKLLEAQATAGVDVRVIGKCKGAKKIDVRPLKSMRLHVRALVRDGVRAFVGSQSLRRIELDRRREVGVLITNATVTRQIRDTFETDWAEAESSVEKSTAPGRVVEFAARELA